MKIVENEQFMLGSLSMPLESVVKLISLMLRKEITRDRFVLDSVKLTVKDINE